MTDEGGEVVDEYVGPSITMLRVSASGAVVRASLTIEEVASIDRPPEPDTTMEDALRLDLPQLPPLRAVDANAPLIGIIDSGVNTHPLLEKLLVGSIGVPDSLGTADDCGGTALALRGLPPSAACVTTWSPAPSRQALGCAQRKL